MTKDEVVKAIAKRTGQHPNEVATTVDAFMKEGGEHESR